MNFGEWLSLSDAEREAEKRRWHVFEPGYWHAIAVEAAARFLAEFGSKRHVTQVFKSLYRARELVIAVQTDLITPKEIKLPQSYLGFRVMQFASQIPEGVLVQPSRPGKSRRTKGARRAEPLRGRRARVDSDQTEHPEILSLEGEIDLDASARITPNLRSLIQNKPKKLVIDLSRVPYIDSSGLALLIDAMRRVEAYRGKLYLVGMQESVRVIFETSRLNQAFRIRSNVADALAAS
jgi:anti-sigma B factor antagonist